MQGKQSNSNTVRDTAITGCDREGFTMPVLEYGHSEGRSASVTGGYVYRGEKLGGFYGAYLYGDYVDGRISALRYKDGEAVSNDVVATISTPARFGEDQAGEVYILSIERGWIYALESRRSEPTAILEETPTLPQVHALYRSYPNPFNSQAKIHYELRTPDHVDLGIYNTVGQKVVKLLDAEMEAGSYVVVWDGRDWHGKDLASGVYLCRMKAGSFSQVRKLILL